MATKIRTLPERAVGLAAGPDGDKRGHVVPVVPVVPVAEFDAGVAL